MQTFLFYLALCNGLVLIAALLTRKENQLANLFLAGAIASTLYCQFIVVLYATGKIAQIPILIGSAFPVSLLGSALLYLYTLALTSPGFRWLPRYFAYFLPSVIALLWYGVSILLGKEMPAPGSDAFFIERYFRLIFIFLVSGVFLLACLRQLRRYQSRVKAYFSELRRVRLKWLWSLLILFSGPWLIELVDLLTGPYLTLETVLVPVVTVVILLIGFFGLRQSALFAPDENWQFLPEEEKATSKELKPPLFTSEEVLRWKRKIEKLLEEEKPYLNPELRLVDLAKGLNLKPYQTSELLNQGMGISFYDFINRYRIEEAKRRLSKPEFSHMNILGIAIESGFNSKSVFNETFRRMTGTTPSAWRDASFQKHRLSS